MQPRSINNNSDFLVNPTCPPCLYLKLAGCNCKDFTKIAETPHFGNIGRLANEHKMEKIGSLMGMR